MKKTKAVLDNIHYPCLLMSYECQESSFERLTIDCHHHFFTKESVPAFKRIIPEGSLETNPEFKQFLDALPTVEERAQLTVEEMAKSKVDEILLMSFSGDFENVCKAQQMFPQQFPGLVPFVDPRFDAPDVLEEYKSKKAVGVKFYPGAWGNDFNFDDERVFPYLAKCLELDLIPMIHFGVMKGGPNNLASWPASPLQLRPWLQNPKLQEQKYIIAHFGAGYLREIFLMAYSHKERIYVDSSGSNDWILWSPFTSLTQVFEKAIIALSPQQILFGTDSGRLTMRHDVVLRQKGILEDLVTRKIICDEDRWDILGNNCRQLMYNQ
ncbi:MAG: amidohydrolase family protein [Candidatus Hodarchaeales archaeon]